MTAGFLPAVAAGAVPAARRPPSLPEIRAAGEHLHRALEDAVVRYRLHGASWAEVGRALGITRQSAHERFRYLDDHQANGFVVELRGDGRAHIRSLWLNEDVVMDRRTGRPIPARAAAQLRELRPIVEGELAT